MQPAMCLFIDSYRLRGGTGAAMAMAPPQCAAELPGMTGMALLSSVSASDAPARAAMGDPPPPSLAAAHWRGHKANYGIKVSEVC